MSPLFSAIALTMGLMAGDADKLLDEQLDLLADKDIKSTVRILKKVNKFFLLEHKEEAPSPTPTDAQKQLGYILFSRNYLEEVYYNTNPRPYEIKSDLSIFATPGEYEPVSFGVYPLEDLKGVTVAGSDLAGPNNATIQSDAVDIRFTRQLARGTQPFMWMVGPEALETFTAVDIPKGRTTQFWMTVHVPDAAKPGEYKGTLSFRPANRPASELKLTLVVLPFSLPADTDATFGWYYNGRAETIRQELADMRAHGANAITVPDPRVRNLTRNGQADVDFSAWDNYRTLLAEAGMKGVQQTGVGGIAGAVERLGIKELGEGFEVPFVAALRKHKEWLDAHPDLRAVFVIFDEPRESMLNSWNRTYDQTVAYIKLCRKVPGLLISVDPMGDTNDRKDYTPFATMVDILNTHAWEGSKKLIELTKKSGNTLWVYNNGYSRLAWGFSMWKVGAKGNWQWMYAGWGGGDGNQYSPIPIAGFENEGESNTGPFPVYAFKDKAVPTPKYEWVREGIDDYRYVYTLLEKLKQSKPDATGRADAEKLLKEIEQAVPEYPATGLKTGAEAGGAGDPAPLLAWFDNFRWRIALSILELEDAAKGRKRADPDSLYAAYSKLRFGEIPPEMKLQPKQEAKPEQAVEIEKTKLAPGAKMLYDFETDECLKQLETDRSGDEPFDPDIMPAKRVKRFATHGDCSLYYEPVPKGGGLHLINFDGNWQGYDFVRVDFYNPNDRPISGHFTVTDANTRVPPNSPRAMGFYDDRFDMEAFAVPPGTFTLQVRLGGLSTNGGRQLDLSKIKKVALGCEANNVPFYIDCIRLEKE